jgi:thermostable 8-oxoguanine DNA glycosylase
MFNPTNSLANGTEASPIGLLVPSDTDNVSLILEQIQQEYQRLLLNPSGAGGWRALSEMDLWFLFCHCLLAPDRRDGTALSSVAILWEKDHLNPYLLAKLEKGAKKALAATLETLLGSKNGKQQVQQLVDHAEELVIRGPSLTALLKESRSDHHAREQLCARFQGVGLQEASMFLRDCGYAQEVIVVDGPIVQYLQIHDMVNPGDPDFTLTPSTYQMCEYLFRGYCELQGWDCQRMARAIRKILE